MKNQLSKFVLIYGLFLLLSVVVYGCCKVSERILYLPQIDTFTIYDFKENRFVESNDTLRNSFKVEFRIDRKDLAFLNKGRFVNKLNACDVTEYVNTVEENSLKVSLDQDFIYQNKVIKKETNLLSMNLSKDSF